MGLCYGWHATQLPLDPGPHEGLAHVRWTRCFERNIHHQKRRCVEGHLLSFHQNERIIAQSIPCKMLLAKGASEPTLGCAYSLPAKLYCPGPGQALLTASKAWSSSVPKALSRNVPETRRHLQSQLYTFLEQQLGGEKSLPLVYGLLTGDFRDEDLVQDFQRVGLSHLLALSGFHFSMIAAVLSAGFAFFLPPRSRHIFLLVTLSIYYLFVGPSYSMTRAWIACLLFLAAPLIGRTASPLNSLGLALAVVLISSPTAPFQLGFQLSFLATASLLLFYGPFERALGKIFPRRRLRQLRRLSLGDQHLVLLSAYFRRCCALSLSVNVLVAPWLLCHQFSFPLIAFIYNLFFPPLVALIIFWALSACCLHYPFPTIAALLWTGLKAFCSSCLHCVHNLPQAFCFPMSLPFLRCELAPYLLIPLLLIGVRLWNQSERVELPLGLR
jgi:competence protein ComEC